VALELTIEGESTVGSSANFVGSSGVGAITAEIYVDSVAKGFKFKLYSAGIWQGSAPNGFAVWRD